MPRKHTNTCPACKYKLEGLDHPRLCPECGHLIRGPLPRGRFRLPAVCRAASLASLALSVVGASFVFGSKSLQDIGDMLIAAAGLASFVTLALCVLGILAQRSRPQEPRYRWTIALGLVSMVAVVFSQHL
jgi:hypothetical protein